MARLKKHLWRIGEGTEETAAGKLGVEGEGEHEIEGDVANKVNGTPTRVQKTANKPEEAQKKLWQEGDKEWTHPVDRKREFAKHITKEQEDGRPLSKHTRADGRAESWVTKR